MIRAVVLLLAACGSNSASAPEPTREPSSTPPALAFPDAPVRLPAAIPAGTTQLITAIVDDWTSTHATLRSWRLVGGNWQSDGDAWAAVVGRNGVAWGIGYHGTGAPAGRGGPTKHEGDGKAPAGVFAIGRAFGYAPAPPQGTRVPYVAVDASWKCVDDPKSTHYTQILDERSVTVDWKSAEDMRRKDDLYTWVIDIGHNSTHTPGGGSCIFFHVWAGEDSSTTGCTAMAEPRVAHLLATLDASAVYVLLPRAEYAALSPAWNLPR